MVLISHSEKRALWNERINEFLASGQSRQAWCRNNDVSAQQLGYWLRKSQSSPENQAESSRWVSMNASSSADSRITIRIGELSLEVERGFDPEGLSDVGLTLMTLC